MATISVIFYVCVYAKHADLGSAQLTYSLPKKCDARKVHTHALVLIAPGKLKIARLASSKILRVYMY